MGLRQPAHWQIGLLVRGAGNLKLDLNWAAWNADVLCCGSSEGPSVLLWFFGRTQRTLRFEENCYFIGGVALPAAVSCSPGLNPKRYGQRAGLGLGTQCKFLNFKLVVSESFDRYPA